MFIFLIKPNKCQSKDKNVFINQLNYELLLSIRFARLDGEEVVYLH